jgi:hypothetical protein
MAQDENRVIELEELSVDLENPRYPTRASQRDAIAKMVEHQGLKLANLAEDIVENGLNPTRRFLVTPASGGGYTVLEGNRRIAALKLLTQKELRTSLNLPTKIEKRLQALADAAGPLPTSVDCAVRAPEDAKHWIQLEHTGENEGRGVVGWDGPARQRFRGGSPALQAVDLVTPYLDEKTKALLPEMSITNIERLLNTPEARHEIGVELSSGKLSLKQPEDKALSRLAAVVSDVAHRKIRVTHLDSKDQRVAYAREVAARPITALKGPTPGTPGTPASPSTPTTKRVPLQRATLIPRQLKLSIKPPRVNRIYDELQRLRLKNYVNSGAVLLRVFVELSIDEYANRRSLSLRVTPTPKPGSTKAPAPRDMKLKEKVKVAADDLEKRGVCTKPNLQGVRALMHKHHPLSIDSLHAYVHNAHYSPSVSDLTQTWDNIEPFVIGLWKP